MLQIDLKPFASDALEDAMRLAQTKSLNSFTFTDCLNYLNYAWSDIYGRVANIDSGYYSKVVRLTQKLTKLPPFVRNTVKIFQAQGPQGFNRKIYRSAPANCTEASLTYYISGTDLYCFDADRTTVWLEYCPSPVLLTFPFHNRDPILHDEYTAPEPSMDYGTRRLRENLGKWELVHKGDVSNIMDITDKIVREGCDLAFIGCDWPYIFVTYEDILTGQHISGFLDKDLEWNTYNPFDFTGRKSNVEYLKVGWNDKTGMGVVVKDYNDNEKIKELGWTPDMVLDYPAPEMYRYLVARLAQKFSALNESNVMGVQQELFEARYAFEAFLEKDKSAFKRITNVTSPTLGDLL